MAETKPPLSPPEQAEALAGFLRVLLDARREMPTVTVNDLMAVLYIAYQTLDRRKVRLPTVTDVTADLELSISGASRVLADLAEGSKRKGRAPRGAGLISTDTWIEGRKVRGHILTPKGREFVAGVLGKLTGRPLQDFDPQDEDGLFRDLIARWKDD